MSEIGKFPIEQKQNQPNLLNEFKLRISSVDQIKTLENFEKLNPEDPKLYEKLRSISEQFPKLPQWFMIMCGEKFQSENVKQVMKSLML
jgi:hypothetical protein